MKKMNTSNLIVLTDEEKRIVKELDHRLYTVEFLEEWINHDDNVFIDAPAALQTMMACGYYEAVKMMAKQDTQQRKNAWRDETSQLLQDAGFEDASKYLDAAWEL